MENFSQQTVHVKGFFISWPSSNNDVTNKMIIFQERSNCSMILHLISHGVECSVGYYLALRSNIWINIFQKFDGYILLRGTSSFVWEMSHKSWFLRKRLLTCPWVQICLVRIAFYKKDFLHMVCVWAVSHLYVYVLQDLIYYKMTSSIWYSIRK